MCWGVSETFSGDAFAPAHARDLCADQLRSALADLPGRDDLIFDAKVIASELLTNSVRAGSRLMRLSLSLHRDVLRLTVDDDAPGAPERRVPLRDEPSGRGMAIVASLAGGWGVERRIPGKQVWVDLDVPADLTVDLPSCHRPTRFELELPPHVVDGFPLVGHPGADEGLVDTPPSV